MSPTKDGRVGIAWRRQNASLHAINVLAGNVHATATGTTVASRPTALPWRIPVTQRKFLATTLAVGVAALLLWPADARAQHRHGGRGHVSVGVGYGPYYYPSFYGSWWYPYGYPYGWYPPYYGYGYVDSSLRLQVEPRETEVFIDGYWAGTVDDFDGFFQRLHLDPGEHELELYLAGHRSAKQKIYLQPNATFRVRHTMVPLGAGETPDARPVPPAGAPRRGNYDAFGRPERPERPEAPARSERPGRSEQSEFGTLAIRVQPGEAEVIVDGESWSGADDADRLVIQLPVGDHRIEVRREGFATYTSTVRIRAGETANVNVSLARE
jgi:hypothetical protein